MADYRPVAPRANPGEAPVAPMGKVNTGNNYLVNQARQNLTPTNQPLSQPAGLAVNPNLGMGGINRLPNPQLTVAGAAQERAMAGSSTQQADLAAQARDNMGTGSAPQSMGLLERAQLQRQVR